MYAEFLSRSIIYRRTDQYILRMPSENNNSETFPRQIMEITIKDGDLARDSNKNRTNEQKLIDIKFGQRM